MHIKNIIYLILTCIFSLVLSGCLVTRNEVKEIDQRTQMQQQVVSLQRSSADVGNRFNEIESAIRDLSGKVDSFDRKIESSIAADNRSLFEVQKTQNLRMNDLQESLAKMESQIASLTSEITALKAKKENTPQEPTPQKEAVHHRESIGNPPKKSSFDSALDLFKNREWSKAALEFQKFREENPANKKIPEATYKIAYAFQQMGMKDEAVTFYQDVVAKYPKSEEARKAKVKLKALK